MAGVSPLGKLLMAGHEVRLSEVMVGHVVSAAMDASNRKVAEQFDKYNLRCLPVCDEDGRLVGVVHAEDVIAWLRTRQ